MIKSMTRSYNKAIYRKRYRASHNCDRKRTVDRARQPVRIFRIRFETLLISAVHHPSGCRQKCDGRILDPALAVGEPEEEGG